MNKPKRVLMAVGLQIIFCLFIVSCAIREEEIATLKSFSENKEKYYRIAELVKSGRYWYDGIVGVHRFGEDVGITFHSFHVNEDPFYIRFNPVGFYAAIYYLESKKAIEYVYSGNPYGPDTLEPNWYLLVEDWN